MICWKPQASVEKLHHSHHYDSFTLKQPRRPARPFCHQEKDLLSRKQAPPSSAGLRLDLCSASHPVERHQWEEPVPAKSWQILDHSGDGVARSQEDESGIMCRIGREVLTESWMASSLHYYGQCRFAYEGNKHASVSGSRLRLILTSVSWNYLL